MSICYTTCWWVGNEVWEKGELWKAVDFDLGGKMVRPSVEMLKSREMASRRVLGT